MVCVNEDDEAVLGIGDLTGQEVRKWFTGLWRSVKKFVRRSRKKKVVGKLE